MRVIDEPLAKIDCQQGVLRAVRYNVDGQYALTCGSDKTVRLWRHSKGLLLKTYKGHSADVIDCHSNHDNSQLASCSNDRSLIVWDVESGKILRRFRNLAPLNNVCYGHESTTVAISSIDGIVRIYDLRAVNAWEPIQTLTEAKDSVTCCKISGHTIYTVSLDKSLRTYDTRAGKLFVDTLNKTIGHLSLSKTDLCLLVTFLRGSIVLVEKEGPHILNEFFGNISSLFKMETEFLSDDCLLASGSEDGRVYIWDTLESAPQIVLNHKTDRNQVIQSLSTDGKSSILTACDKYLYQWTV